MLKKIKLIAEDYLLLTDIINFYNNVELKEKINKCNKSKMLTDLGFVDLVEVNLSKQELEKCIRILNLERNRILWDEEDVKELESILGENI